MTNSSHDHIISHPRGKREKSIGLIFCCSSCRFTIPNCQNLGASNRTAYPSTTTDKTKNTVDRCVGIEKEDCDEIATREGHASFVSSLISIGLLLVIINLYIVLQQDMIVPKYYILLIVAM